MAEVGEDMESPNCLNLGRHWFFPDIQVKYNCPNVFESSKMVELTLLLRELGDHLTEDPVGGGSKL